MDSVINTIINNKKKLLAFQSNPILTVRKLVGDKCKDEDVFLIVKKVDKYIREKDALKFVNVENYSTSSFSMYDMVYEYATENIRDSICSYDGNDRILTVLSSGDHVLNYLVNGAENIESFDINAFTRYYFELKRACIEKLQYNEFLENADSLITYALDYLDELPLSRESYSFWYYYKESKYPEKYGSFLYKVPYGRKHFNSYFEEKNYDKLQSILKGGINIPFHRIEAINLNKSVVGKFSEINFSSIYSLMSKKDMPKLIRRMSTFLTDGGKMLFYSFGEFEGDTDKYNKMGLYGRNVNDIDKVYTYTKKR